MFHLKAASLIYANKGTQTFNSIEWMGWWKVFFKNTTIKEKMKIKKMFVFLKF